MRIVLRRRTARNRNKLLNHGKGEKDLHKSRFDGGGGGERGKRIRGIARGKEE